MDKEYTIFVSPNHKIRESYSILIPDRQFNIFLYEKNVDISFQKFTNNDILGWINNAKLAKREKIWYKFEKVLFEESLIELFKSKDILSLMLAKEIALNKFNLKYIEHTK